VESRVQQNSDSGQVLTRRGGRSATGIALIVLLAITLPTGEAFATVGGTGSGSCSDSGTSISCGTGVSGGTGTGSATGGGSGQDGGGATTVSVPTCPNYVPYSTEFPGQDGGPPPAGVTQPGAWYVNSCSVGAATGQATGVVWLATGQAAPTVPPPDPAVAGAQAASELQLPSPALILSPSTKGYVNLAEWLWVTPTMWHPLTTSAQACNAGGCVTAAATATPSYVIWNTGDGTTVTCNGPGVAYNTSLSATDPTVCSHTYATTSAGQPSPDGNPNDAAFPITATVTWTVSWSGPDGSAGALPSLTTQGTTSLQVAQIESVNN
jgi:hypothetical protein